MAEQQLQKLLQGALKAARNGDKDLARRAFLQVLKRQPENEAAWFGLATVARDKTEQRSALQRLLTINPQHKQGLAAARKMGLDVDELLRSNMPPMQDVTTENVPADAAPKAQSEQAAEPQPDSDDSKQRQPSRLDTAEIWAASQAQSITADANTEADEAFLPQTSPFAETLAAADEFMAGVDAAEAEETTDEQRPAFADVSLEDATAEEIESLQALIEAPERVTPTVDIYAAFSKLPPPPDGLNGIPTPDFRQLQAIKDEADRRAHTYIEVLKRDALNVQWERKQRARYGERRIITLRLQQAIAALVVFGGLIGLGGGVLLNNPDVQRAIFAPTWTVSPTPTATPTSTPGITPTPSPRPQLTYTPSPSPLPTLTPGSDDPNITPSQTPIYLLSRFGGDMGVQQALELMQTGGTEALDRAEVLLEDSRLATGARGDFIPYYYLTLLYLQRDDPATARQTVQNGEQAWLDRGVEQQQRPVIETAYARVDLYQARRLIEQQGTRSADANEFLQTAETRLRNALQADSRFVDAHLLLAERYRIAGDYTQALTVLFEAQTSGFTSTIFVDTRLRMARAEIYFEQARYDAALQELNELLFINPHERPAHRLRVETVLAQDKPGLGVIYSEAYLFYHPDSVTARRLLGDARRREDKPNEALREYTLALAAGSPTDPAYLDALLARADVYVNQRRYELAQDDLSQALAISGGRADIRVRRMNAAYAAGDYAIARTDTERLQGSNAIDEAELTLLQARILLDQAEAGQEAVYRRALGLLNNSLSGGLSTETRPIANEYLARAHFNLGNYGDALNAVNRALGAADTVSRRYLRAQIYEAQNDFVAALGEYEFVLTWSEVFPLPFRMEAQTRYNALGRIVARST